MPTSLDVQQSFQRSLAQAVDSNTVLSHLLKSICEYTRWSYGEIWTPTQDSSVLELHPTFYITSAQTSIEIDQLEQFRNCSKGLFFSINVGLPGRVWASQQAEWLADVSTSSERVFLRHHIAKAFGVKSGYGIPLLSQNRVLAVLTFFTLSLSQEQQELTELAATLVTYAAQRLDLLDL